MNNSADTQGLSKIVREVREAKGMSQEALASAIPISTSRTAIAHFEQGLRVPSIDTITAICKYLNIPEMLWVAFATPQGRARLVFENALSEMAGVRASLRSADAASIQAVEFHISRLTADSLTTNQALDCINSVLVFYGVRAISLQFFQKYFVADVFASEETLAGCIQAYQRDAIRLHPTLAEAFNSFNDASDLASHLTPLAESPLDHYRERSEWTAITPIEQGRLADLGYISAARIRSEHAEREEAARTLRDLAREITQRGKSVAMANLSERARRRLDTLLRRLNSSIRHDLSSPLFSPDADALEREAAALAPAATDLERMAETQAAAYKNLCHYLSADHLDVYVATSMRSDADYVSVHTFVQNLFSHIEVRPLRLRYFNPTQSWIGDRVAKGLVEALMLRRSSITLYMAQKDDTFGKDSEASVALGQGKPVLVYVPKLRIEDPPFDSAELWGRPKSELARDWKRVEKDASEDDANALDSESLASRIATEKLSSLDGYTFAKVVRNHWADFDLYGEADRIAEDDRAKYRSSLDAVIVHGQEMTDFSLRSHVTSILVANAARFERRARTFRLAHPLALQVVARTRILNGMLVVRDVEICAKLIRGILSNKLEYDFSANENNYELIEKLTRSTVRVIPRHELLRAAFERFYVLNHNE